MKLDDPSNLPRGPQRFVAYLLRDIVADFDKRKWKALVPTTLILCGAAGAATGYFASAKLWDDLGRPIAFYTAVLTANAILLAICWAAFARTLDTIGDPEFGGWLRFHKLDAYYGFYIEYIQLAQMIGLGAAAVGLTLGVLPVPEWVQRTALGIAIATSLHAGRWTAGCVRVMQDLSDHRATFRESRGKVTTLPSGTGA